MVPKSSHMQVSYTWDFRGKSEGFRHLINGATASLHHFLSLCFPCQAAVPHQRFISTATTQQIKGGYEDESIAAREQGEDRASLSSLARWKWLRPAADKEQRTTPSCKRDWLLLPCLCKGRLTRLASYWGSNGYPLALSKFLFNNSSNFLGNTTISRYNGYYIYLHRPCSAGI